MKFIFDLDGVITSQDILSNIAKRFSFEKEVEEITNETSAGNIPFIESFIRTFHLLGKFPVSDISKIVGSIPLNLQLWQFIVGNKQDCVITTMLLDCWIQKLSERLDCTLFSSEGIVVEDRITSISKILKKENIVKYFKNQGETVVFIGDSINDMEAMRLSDIVIATGLIHHPSKSVLPYTDYLIFNEEGLCRQLNQLL